MKEPVPGSPNKDRILVVEDDPSIRRILCLQLEMGGYRVMEADNGIAALRLLERELPDLILLDMMMPQMDGNETCRRIREQPRLRHLPVIFLTAKAAQESRILALDEGANDYLTKPYDRTELLLRIKNLIGWGRAQRNSNPLTGLPGNPAIEAEVQGRLDRREPFAFLYLDLDYFKAFNDFYSYRAGDEVIKLMARVLVETIESEGNPEDFVGHVGGDDFVAVTTPGKASTICDEVVTRFDEEILRHYRPAERSRGYVEIENRLHVVERFPLVSVTIALIESERYRIEHMAMLNDVVAEVKRHGKQHPGSVVVRDRREDPPSEILRTGSDG